MRQWPRRLLGLGLCALSAGLQAQTPQQPEPGAAQRLDRERLERYLQEQRAREAPPAKPEITLPPAPAAPEAAEVPNIPVKGFRVTPSEILTEAEIRAVLAPLEGRTVSLKDLFDAVAALNKLYADKHMPTARAFLPPQEIRDGVVEIRLVEARVGAIKVEGLAQQNPAFVIERLRLAPGRLMSVDTLEADLYRFNRLHDTQLRASVTAGSQFGTTDLQVQATEPQRVRLTAFLDNAGQDTLGQGRVGLIANVANPLRRGDALNFTASATEGSKNFYLSYSLPLTADDLRLDLSLSHGNIDVIRGAYAPLDISGRSQDITVGLSKPLVVDSRRLWTVYGRLSARESVNEFGGVDQSNLDLGVLSLGASGEFIDGGTTRFVDFGLGLGMKILGGEEHFKHLRVSATQMMRSGERTQLVLRGSAQYSPSRVLPGSEQFQVGGAYTVRGYSEGILTGRSGYVGSVELRYALTDPAEYLLRPPGAPVFNGFVFVDHGAAFPYLAGSQEYGADYFLTGAGGGVLFEWGKRMSGRLAIA